MARDDTAERFAAELGRCLGEIVGDEPPAPDDDAVRFFGQWLAGRNLGLVPIADAAAFAWAGPWLARVRHGDADHAVVMFGSPSGAVVDLAGAVAAGGAVVEGWVVAPLDLSLGTERPYGTDAHAGRVAALLLAPAAEAALAAVDEADAVPGRGLAGDRYAAGLGTFGRSGGRGYELTLVEAEVLDELGIAWERARRNVVTRGASLNPLVGRRFRIGDVECVGRRLAEPCAHLERVSGDGLLRPLVHRGGLRADILVGGTIRVGDVLAPLD